MPAVTQAFWHQADGLKVDFSDGLLTIALAHPKATNPFSRVMTRALHDLALTIQTDSAVRGVLLWGGDNRAFSVGGDFEDVSRLEHPADIRAYLLEIIDLYVMLLAIEVPVVVAIDRHAIGQGLQVALSADWRVGTDRTQLAMPELRNGVACPLGTVLLGELLGRAAMQRLVIGCDTLDANHALALGLLSEVVSPSELLTQARTRLQTLVAYPSTPYRLTKRLMNRPLIQSLHAVREEAAAAHIASFRERAGHAHFERILGKN
jgi:enoyl-CoA hydratase/carnithine racemase